MSIPPVYSSYCYDDAQLAHCPQNSQQAESRGQAPAHDIETQDTASFSGAMGSIYVSLIFLA